MRAILSQKTFIFEKSKNKSVLRSKLLEAGWPRGVQLFEVQTTEHGLPLAMTFSSLPSRPSEYEEWDDFFSQEATAIGVQPEELRAAIWAWGAALDDPLDRGLFDLYRGDFASAIAAFQQSKPQGSVEKAVQTSVGAAYCEFRLGRFELAEKYLREALAISPNDPLLQGDLDTVRRDAVRARSGKIFSLAIAAIFYMAIAGIMAWLFEKTVEVLPRTKKRHSRTAATAEDEHDEHTDAEG